MPQTSRSIRRFRPLFLWMTALNRNLDSRSIIKGLECASLTENIKLYVMKQSYFIGIDVSKKKVDITVLDSDNKVLLHQVVKNQNDDLVSFFRKLSKKLKVGRELLLVCCEETGVYTKPIKQTCSSIGIALWVENAYKIKKAATDFRGKNDKKDSARIAEYAFRFVDKQRLYVEPSEEQARLQALLSARETILGDLTGYKQQLSESQSHDPKLHQVLSACYKKCIKSLTRELKSVEKEIQQLVKASTEISKTVNLLTSIPGIGKVVATNFVVFTKNFCSFQNAKQLACYAGVVPFSNQSGTINKGDRVSSFANKKLKTLLHLAAMSVIRTNGELKDYFLKKVKQGKNKMLVINAVRNKLVQRMFAVVSRGTPYIPLSTEEEVSIN